MKTTSIKALALAVLMGLWAGSPARAQVSAADDGIEWGLRSNVLTWVLGAPGIGVDVSFAGRWQAGIDGAYGSWDLSHDCEGLRITTAGVQVRRYFRPFGTPHVGRDVNGDGVRQYGSRSRGWFLGLDARYTHWNEQFFTAGGGTEGDALTAGVVAGYSFVLSRDGRWGVDALLGVGFVHREYDDYVWYAPAAMNRLTDSHDKNQFGLTTAEVSFTYKF